MLNLSASPRFTIRLLAAIAALSIVLNIALVAKYGVVASLLARIRTVSRHVPPVSARDHIRGSAGAVNTIIEYSDYQCSHCRVLHGELKQLLAASGNTRWVIRHKPMVDMHPLALKAAIAAECAGEQNAFWEYSDGLFEYRESFSEAFFEQLARARGLDISKFNACRSGPMPDAIRKGLSEAEYLDIAGTPTFYVNGRRLTGAVPYSLLEAAVAVH